MCQKMYSFTLNMGTMVEASLCSFDCQRCRRSQGQVVTPKMSEINKIFYYALRAFLFMDLVVVTNHPEIIKALT